MQRHGIRGLFADLLRLVRVLVAGDLAEDGKKEYNRHDLIGGKPDFLQINPLAFPT
jgi:hypothetical protein